METKNTQNHENLSLDLIDIITLWAQLLLEFSTDHFETKRTCSTWSVDVHVVWGYPLIIFIFISTFST